MMSLPRRADHWDQPQVLAEDVISRASSVLSPVPLDLSEVYPIYGDHVIAGLPTDPAFIAKARPAAVLMPIVRRAEGLTLLLTERSAHLNTHAGQVAFPGGRIDPGEGAFDAALREADEEIGLPAHAITPLGFLPPYYSGTGFRVQPLVAVIPPDLELRPNPAEVERVFEVPLATVLDLQRYRRGTIFWQGQERLFYILDYPGAYIWGVTAGIMRSFAERY
jgi:8-oxo-dGTP pyrophosphatase MutT (NUDIX family)